MKLTMYMGRAGTGKSYACYERIREIITTCPGEPIILLVPDPATYRTERELAAFMPEGGFTTVRVVGFGRLAHQVFQSLGKAREDSLSDIGQKLVLRLLLKRHADKLEVLRRAASQPHFADVLQGLLAECKAFRVTAEDLRTGADKVDSMGLAGKLRELAYIKEQYETMTDNLWGSDEDSMEELIRCIGDSPLLQQAHVIVDGFHWFTPLQNILIQRMFALAKESILTVTLPAETEPERYARPGQLFYRPYEVYATYKERYGKQLLVRRFTKQHRFQSPVLEALEKGYFAYPSQGNQSKDTVAVVRAYNREREVDAICRRISSLVREEGYRWRDITIMLRESETYGDILEKGLAQYGIPFFTDRRHPMRSHPLAELLTGLLEIVQSRFNHDAVFRLLKTDFFPLSREEVDLLENYCLEFGIRELMWLKPEWTYRRRDTGPEGSDSYERETLRVSRIQNIHSRIVPLWQLLWDFGRQSHTGYEWCEHLYTCLESLHVPRTLSQWSREAVAEGLQEEADSHEQMYKRVIRFFDEVMLLAKTELLAPDEIAVLLREGLDEVTYSLVPPSLDHVAVTTVERGYTTESAIVFVPGINEGVFPQRMGDEGFLKDKERTALQAAGITLAAGALVRAFNEQFLFYIACSRARQRLYISYAGSGEDGSSLEPSLAIKRLASMGYTSPPMEAPLTMPDGDETDYMWTPQQSLRLLAGRVSEAVKGQSVNPLWWSLYDWSLQAGYYEPLRLSTRGALDTNEVPLIETAVVDALLLRGNALDGSVTRLESYQRCPFAFYAQYALQLAPRKVKSFGAPEMGTFLHENLRRLGMLLLSQERQWRDVQPEELQKICADVVADTTAELLGDAFTDAYEEALQQRLEATLQRTVYRLSDWSKRSVFDTVYVEQGFGNGPDSWPAVPIALGGNHYIRLRGQLDRVDEYRIGDTLFGLVIDYKSGGAAVSASDIYYGLKLQLVTYLLALERAQHSMTMLPAALVYTYVKNPQISDTAPLAVAEAEKKSMTDTSLRNSGYFAHDHDILLKMDDSLAGRADTSPYVPVRLKKSGDIYSSDLRKVKTVGEFKTLTDYACRVMAKAGQHILEGHFPLSPYNLDGRIPCSFCQYRVVCRFENMRNRYRYIHGLSEEEGMRRMAEGGTVYEVDPRSTEGD